MLSYASLVKHNHPKTISTSRSHLLGTSESRESYNSNSKKASYVDWRRSSVLPNGRMLASMCLMPATKRNKEDKVLRLGTREARLPNTMDSMSVPCAHVSGPALHGQLACCVQWPCRRNQTSGKNSEASRQEDIEYVAGKWDSERKKPLYMHIICNQSKQICLLLLGATGKKTEHFSMLHGNAKWKVTIFSTTVDLKCASVHCFVSVQTQTLMNNITTKRLLTRLLHSELDFTTRQPQVLQKQIFFSLYQTQSNSSILEEML